MPMNKAALDHVVYAPLGWYLSHQAWRKNVTGIVKGPRADRRYSALMPANLITLAHFSRTQKPFSALWKVTGSMRPASTSWVDDSGCGFIRIVLRLPSPDRW
jgi:hypothetical protein